MESDSSKTIQNELYNEEDASELIIIEDNKNNLNASNDMNIYGEEEHGEFISDEEYLVDCCRYGEIEELKNLFTENPNININYYDANKNNSLRKWYSFLIIIVIKS